MTGEGPVNLNDIGSFAMQNIRIAAAVVRCPVGEIESNLARTAHWVEQARQAGAELICFPEMNITGYTNRAELLACAQPLPGPVSQIGRAHV